MASGGEAKLDMYDDFSGSVEGEMIVPNQQQNQQQGKPDFNTLDEPIRDTVLRDLKAVGIKFFHVLYPKEKKSLLKEWDLWGPLLLCTFMAMILQGSSEVANDSKDGGPEFAEVFVIVWIGSMIVTVNSKLLGGNISFFQSVCVLGYCLLPTTIALIMCRIILLMEQTTFLFAIRFIVTVVGFAWATFASMVFLGDSQPPGRKALAVYPMFLFYFIISWLVISHTTT
ncbi:protein YIPF6 [Schistocerca americana]|uniref:protein YIPF6 n=1 Tax=Schistocerca americana TaxID=7009 RepID=UPI001F4FDD9D|nr:protein YIPF6 [Schistocerca americana]XP_047119612.1 protein YIPF6 [Schistocerca piceifrons]XP_049763970.1 protein YIPF6 [Schistocerca cancellata]XP_049789142.1 protein YIPF6 [Schistocerca nitens]XP_049833443.1 protein YIPF6 isoform X1 [Schistocerca gregaria]XP_049940492.1 protein YIPF6 [Schistocerca serialis cubense]